MSDRGCEKELRAVGLAWEIFFFYIVLVEMRGMWMSCLGVVLLRLHTLLIDKKAFATFKVNVK